LRANKVFFFLIVSITFYLCSCGNKTQQQLAYVDSLLNKELQDSAQRQMNCISRSAIHDDETRAYYNLLATRLLYREDKPIRNGSLIDFSISYYRKSGNSARLAECDYYKGGICEDRGNTKEAIDYLKKGEYLAKGLKDLNIIHKIEELLASVNENHNEYAISLHYAKKALALSRKAHNANWTANALQYIAVDYNNLGKNDSALAYFDQAKNLIKYASPSSQADYYSNLASVFSNDTTLSKEYILKAEEVGPNSTTYLVLSDLLEKRREYDRAIAMLDKAWSTAPMDHHPWILKRKAGIYSKEGKHIESEKLYQKAYNLQDSVNSVTRKKDLSKLQLDYDYQIRSLHARQTLSYVITALIIVVLIGTLIVLLVIFYRKYNFVKERRSVMEKQALINLYQAQITKLTKNGENTKKKIAELHLKIHQLTKDQTAVYHQGKQLYDDLRNGGTTVSWDKDNFARFIEYYRLDHLELINTIETHYENLSSKNTFFLILQNEKTSNDETMRIMGISAGAIRMINHRIKMKEKVRKQV
jgi:tetratricopeptide (TPR) repeat protein